MVNLFNGEGRNLINKEPWKQGWANKLQKKPRMMPTPIDHCHPSNIHFTFFIADRKIKTTNQKRIIKKEQTPNTLWEREKYLSVWFSFLAFHFVWIQKFCRERNGFWCFRRERVSLSPSAWRLAFMVIRIFRLSVTDWTGDLLMNCRIMRPFGWKVSYSETRGVWKRNRF